MKKLLLAILLMASTVLANETQVLKIGQQVPNFKLINQNGRKTALEDSRGKVVLLTFLFTQCPYPDKCPMIASKLQQTGEILESLGAEKKVQVLSVTLDPKRDTPEALKAYTRHYSVKHVNWQFLTGEPQDIERVATEFGVIYWDEKGTVQHNMRTAVLDQRGRLVKIFTGSSWTSKDVAATVQRLLQ